MTLPGNENRFIRDILSRALTSAQTLLNPVLLDHTLVEIGVSLGADTLRAFRKTHRVDGPFTLHDYVICANSRLDEGGWDFASHAQDQHRIALAVSSNPLGHHQSPWCPYCLIAAGFLGSIAGDLFGFAKAAPRRNEEPTPQACGVVIYLQRTSECLAATGFSFPRAQPTGPMISESSGEPPLALLSHRELEVLRLITEGLGDKQIAEALHLSVRTIEGHLARIRGKLRLQSRGELIRYGFRRRLANP